MQQFTIKDIENLSGIKAHTWRIWEQRYGLGMPQRKDSNHRFYDNENLKEILRISYLYHGGIKISKIASLNSEEIRMKALHSSEKQNDYEYYIKELVEAAIDLNEERFERTFDESVLRLGIEESILHVSYPFQDKIGLLWLTDHLIPSQEHFTSNIIRRKLTVAIDNLPPVKETTKKHILLFTPQQEHHELPLQFIHYKLKKNGNRVIYFGSNVSVQMLQDYAEYKPFDYMYFHLVTNLTNKSAQEYTEQLSQLFNNKKIVMSGVMAAQIEVPPTNLQLLRSLEEIADFVNE